MVPQKRRSMSGAFPGGQIASTFDVNTGYMPIHKRVTATTTTLLARRRPREPSPRLRRRMVSPTAIPAAGGGARAAGRPGGGGGYKPIGDLVICSIPKQLPWRRPSCPYAEAPESGGDRDCHPPRRGPHQRVRDRAGLRSERPVAAR